MPSPPTPPDSYAYDGKRQKVWNKGSRKYGEAWMVGDVIGCCLDLDAGTISYYRCAHHSFFFFFRLAVCCPYTSLSLSLTA